MSEKSPTPEDLKQQNHLLYAALANAGIGTWSLDPIHKRVRWDERCRALYGFAQGETINYDEVLHYVFPDDRAMVQTAVGKALKYESGGRYEATFRTLGPSGQIRWIHCKGQAYLDENQVVRLFAGTAQDVTDIVNYREIDHAISEHSRLALQSARAGSFKLFVDTGALEYSPLLKKMFTGTAEGLVTREDLVQRVHPDDILIRDIAYDVARRTGQLNYEVRVIWYDGTVRWVKITGTYQFDSDGKPLVLSGIAVDSTDTKNAWNAIADSEAQFRALIQQAPIATCLFTGKDMVIAIANEIMISYWGKGWSVMNKPLAEAVPELKGQPFLDILDEIYRTGKTVEAKASPAQLELNGKLDTYYFDFTYKPIFDADGKIYGIVDMAVDVTEKVKAERQADAANTALRSAIRIANLDVWEIDPAREEIIYTEKIKQWMGSGDTRSSLKDFPDLADEQHRENMRTALANLKNSGWKEPYDIEFAITDQKTGIRRILHSRGKPVFDKNGTPIKVVGVTQDITEQADARLTLERLVQTRTEELAASNEELAASNEELTSTVEELAQANSNLNRSNQELEQYAYASSHDLQEPLRKIQIFTDRLMKDTSLGVKQILHAQKISESAKRMTYLIRDLLNFSRVQSESNPPELIDLNKVVKEVLNDLEMTITDEKAIIHMGHLPTVEGFEGQLNQLFYNLLSNALKFRSDRAPVISLQARVITPEPNPELSPEYRVIPGKRYVDITVADNGIGFGEQYSKQIFEIFRRLHTRKEYPGSGIGLALCKKIVTTHGGYITVESRVDQGSTFHIILPESGRP